MDRRLSVAAGVVIVVGLGVGTYLWRPWIYGQPAPVIEAPPQVQTVYRQLLDFVPIVPAQLPPGYKVLTTQVNTDTTPIPTAEMKKFYVSYSNRQNDVLTLIEDKQSIPQPLNGMLTSRVRMDGTTVTVGKSSLIAVVNLHLHGVYISGSLISTLPVAENKTNVTRQRQELLNFVENMIRHPAQLQAQPDYTYIKFEGKYADQGTPSWAVTPTAKSLETYQLSGTNDPMAQITTHGNSSLSDMFYMYSSDTGQIIVDERRGAYQQHDGLWKRATDLGTVSNTMTVDDQKVYRGKDGLSMMWLDSQNNVLYTVTGMSQDDQAQAQKVMASVIKQALALNSHG